MYSGWECKTGDKIFAYFGFCEFLWAFFHIHVYCHPRSLDLLQQMER